MSSVDVEIKNLKQFQLLIRIFNKTFRVDVPTEKRVRKWAISLEDLILDPLGKLLSSFLKMGQSRPLFVYFRCFLDTISIIQIEKSIDGVLGI